MAGLLDENQFDKMSFGDKLGSLLGGHLTAMKYGVTNLSDYMKHDSYPEYLSGQLKGYYPQLGQVRTDRSPLDVAMNYGGGYQFGSMPSVNLQDADKMAKAYQLRGYMWDNMLGNKPRMDDAWKDYQENMDGVRQAILDRNNNKSFDHDKNMAEATRYALESKKVTIKK